MAFHRSIVLPGPFYLLDVFSLVEPAGETKTEFLFRNRLYMKSRHAEGGKILLKDVPSPSIPKTQTPFAKDPA